MSRPCVLRRDWSNCALLAGSPASTVRKGGSTHNGTYVYENSGAAPARERKQKAMQLSVEGDLQQHRDEDGFMLLPAKDGARRCYTVAISLQDWATLARTPRDPIAEVEYLALTGRWETLGRRKVWRVCRA